MHRIRPAAVEDAPAIARVHVDSWRAAYRGLLPADFLAGLSVESRQRTWESVIAQGHALLLVAVAEDEVIGFCSAGQPTDDYLRAPGTSELWTLYVAPSAWSTGAGRDLWLAAERDLLAGGASRVVLWVLQGNERAIRFYRRAGFEHDPSGHKRLEVPGAVRDELLMVKELAGASAARAQGGPVAVISDVHGNLVALEAVVADMRRFGAAGVICLGDVAAMGPQPSAAVELLRSLAPITILGNTDDYLLNPRTLEQFPEVTDATRYHLETERWGADQLGAEGLAWLETFAPSVTLEVGGCRVVAYHGSPLSYDDHVGPTTSEEALASYLAGSEADLYLGGHIHLQFARRYRRAVVANPGSVGMAFDRLDGRVEQPAIAEYALLYVVDGQPNLHLRRVPYDVERLVAAVRASGMPHPERYLQLVRR